MEEHHGREVGHEVVHVEGHLGVKGWDDAVGGNDLEVVGALEDVLELVAFGADAEVVEDDITFGVGEFGGFGGSGFGFFDGFEILVGLSLWKDGNGTR
jgi:hypothetical protein